MYSKGFEETGSGSSHRFVFYINLSCRFGKIKPAGHHHALCVEHQGWRHRPAVGNAAFLNMFLFSLKHELNIFQRVGHAGMDVSEIPV